jgi:hypothetical protein
MKTELTGGYIFKHKHYSEFCITYLKQAMLIPTTLLTLETLMLATLLTLETLFF